MTRGSHIVAVGEDQESALPEATISEPQSLDGDWADETPTDTPSGGGFSWFEACVLLGISVWTGLCIWALLAEPDIASDPARVIGWVWTWSLPVLLTGILWLVFLRGSRRESARFSKAAQLLSTESMNLEERLRTVNHELSLAREFLAAQSRDLASLGRVAAERLSENAERLQTLVNENSAQIDNVSTVSAAALENMERLRSQLPVIANTSKDVTNNIANAGRTAHSQLQEMVRGFNRLNEFGQASERQVAMLRDKVGEALSELAWHSEQLDEAAKTRFVALTDRGEELRAHFAQQEEEAVAAIRHRATTLADELAATAEVLDQNEAEHLTSLRARLSSIRDEGQSISRALRESENSAINQWNEQVSQVNSDLATARISLEEASALAASTVRDRIAALSEEMARFDDASNSRASTFAAQLETRRGQTEQAESEAMALHTARMASVDEEIAQRQSGYQRHVDALMGYGETIAERLEQLEGRIAAIADHGQNTSHSLTSGLSSLDQNLRVSQETLSSANNQLTELVEVSVRLLDLIHASAEHSRAELPDALASGETRLQDLETRIFALRDAVHDAGDKSDNLSSHVLTTNENVRAAIVDLNALHDQVDIRQATHLETLSQLSSELSELSSRSEHLSTKAQTELADAIRRFSETAADALAGLERDGSVAVENLTQKLRTESDVMLSRTLDEHTGNLTGRLEQSAAVAAGVSRDAAIQLRDQLAMVNELTENLERRIAYARQRAEENVDNDFARRAAVITEDLNSNAIDIAKALSSDISDTAWAAYLRGDRGIFTRRAVSLIDSGDARSIAHLYENDRQFAGNVSRYIHDFEAMLRELLSTRDGHAFSVTLLSSDMGKLYVSLAQGIERLRN